MKYDLVPTRPVARFWYKGSHTHPVRRTVLVIESTKEYIRGYELREGNVVRTAGNAPVKTYTRSRIARATSLRMDHPLRKIDPNSRTLVRLPLMDIIEAGA
jgi:hypothetical protein